jgi:xanthine dehydrogenase accessory factor
MSDRRFLHSFAEWSARGEPLVLASVVGTDGSTYRKTGAQMLINAAGDFTGLLSGGCLEGDLAEHARAVLAEGRARLVRYDMRDARHDELWGLGLGCNGLIEILLQPLFPGQEYQPLAQVAALMARREPALYWLVIASSEPDVQPGAAILQHAQDQYLYGIGADDAARLLEGAPGLSVNEAAVRFVSEGLEVVVLPLRPPPRLVVLGGGPDVAPLLTIADQLGWDSDVYDHRPAYIGRLRQAGVARAHELSGGEPLPASVLARADGVVIMSHHLRTDLHYLQQVAASDVGYVGLLGPSARRERLLADLGASVERLQGRLHAPVGLDLGGEGPAAIALSIIAQLQAILHGRDGGPLGRALS